MTQTDPTAGFGPGGSVPNVAARTVMGVFDRQEVAQAALEDLRQAGISDDALSLVHQAPGTPPQQGSEHTKASSGALTGTAGGALLGGALGLATLVFPGVGALIAGGPILAALSGAVAGGALGGLVGSFSGLGVSDVDAQRYEDAVRAGGIVLAVKTDGIEPAKQIEALLQQHGAQHVSTFQPAI